MKLKIQNILRKLNFDPKKQLGQNFLVDDQLLEKIIDFSKIAQNDRILEIGPGLGILTERLIQSAAYVYAVEIDDILISYLQKKFSNYENFKLIHGDILKIPLPDYNKVVSNIPYSITGPIFEKVFFRSTPVPGILTIEKSLADRIFYTDQYKNFSRITVTVNSFLKPVDRLEVSKSSFYPTPKIPISLIKLKPRANINPFLKISESQNFYLDFIAGIMPYKNKKMSNAITYYSKTRSPGEELTKKSVKALLRDQKIDDKKVFMYSIKDFISLAKKLYYNNINC